MSGRHVGIRAPRTPFRDLGTVDRPGRHRAGCAHVFATVAEFPDRGCVLEECILCDTTRTSWIPGGCCAVGEHLHPAPCPWHPAGATE